VLPSAVLAVSAASAFHELQEKETFCKVKGCWYVKVGALCHGEEARRVGMS